MKNTSANPQAVTSHYDFCKATSDGKHLFSVNAGIPMNDAFDQLSTLISSSISAVEIHATGILDTEDTPGALWQSVHLMNFAYALIQSMHGGQIDHEKGAS